MKIKAMAVETSLGVHDRFNWLNIARWASCFLRVLHIIYMSVLVISISLCFSDCFLCICFCHSFLLCLFSSLIQPSVTFSLIYILFPCSSFLSLFSHLYYHLHSSFFLSSMWIIVKTHSIKHTSRHTCYTSELIFYYMCAGFYLAFLYNL